MAEKEANDLIEEIKINYLSGSHPISFSASQNIYDYYDKKIPIKVIKKVLSAIDSFTLHKEARNKFKRNPTYVYYKRYQFQVDLVELGSLKEFNKPFNFLFNCIDIFTRFAWTVPLKTKQALEVLDAFKTVLHKAESKCQSLLSDRGSEIKNKHMQDFCRTQKIRLLHSDTLGHAGFVERFNRSQKKLIYKYLSQHETHKFINKLSDLMSVYNSRKHRIIGMPPADAEKKENQSKVRQNLMKYYAGFKKKKPEYKVGDTVRIRNLNNPFQKGYYEQFTEEVFRIAKVHTNLPIPLYSISDFNKSEIIEGRFYKNELTPVIKKDYQIAEIIRTKGKGKKAKSLVRFREYDKPQWVLKSSIIDIPHGEN